MVRFQLKERVNLKAGRSAMIPIASQTIPSELVTKFQQSKLDLAGRLVAQIENNTENAIVPGPVAVYRNGDFVGDAIMPRVELKAKSDLMYGVDQAITIKQTKSDVVERVVELEIVDEQVQETVEQRIEVSFTLTNQDSMPREVTVEMEPFDGRRQPKPETDKNGRDSFRYQVAKDSAVVKTVTHIKQTIRSLSPSALSQSDLKRWAAGSTTVPVTISSWIDRHLAIEKRIDVEVAKLYPLEKELVAINREQERMLKLVGVLKDTDKGRKSFVEKIVTFQSRADELRSQIKTQTEAIVLVREEAKSHRSGFGKDE